MNQKNQAMDKLYFLMKQGLFHFAFACKFYNSYNAEAQCNKTVILETVKFMSIFSSPIATTKMCANSSTASSIHSLHNGFRSNLIFDFISRTQNRHSSYYQHLSSQMSWPVVPQHISMEITLFIGLLWVGRGIKTAAGPKIKVIK